MSQWKRNHSEIENKDQNYDNTSKAANNMKKIRKEEELFTAAELGDYKKIAKLLSLGISVEGENYKQGLHHLCKNHHMTPLLVAAANGHVKCIQILIDHGANVNAKDKYGCTAIHFVIQNGNYLCLKTLLEVGADCSVPTQISSHKRKALYVGGTTPLHLAAKYNNVKFVETLIKFGADCNAVDEKGRTSLYIACKAGFQDCALVILKKSCNLSSLSFPSFETSETPLHFAVKYRMMDTIKEMVCLRCNMNHISKRGYSPLHVFVSSHKEKSDFEMKILKLLVVDGYNTNINLTTASGETALDFAFLSIFYDPEFTAFLISYGAESSIMSKQSFLSYQLSMPLDDILLKCLVKTIPRLPRLKSIFSTLLIEYPTDLHSKLEYKISGNANKLYIEVIDHEVDHIIDKLGQISACHPMTKYAKYPLEQPYLDIIHERLVEKLKHMDNNPSDHLHDYYKNYLLMIKKRLWYEQIASVPSTLQHCCRLTVRRIFGSSRIYKLQRLPLPEKIISYLLLESH